MNLYILLFVVFTFSQPTPKQNYQMFTETNGSFFLDDNWRFFDRNSNILTPSSYALECIYKPPSFWVLGGPNIFDKNNIILLQYSFNNLSPYYSVQFQMYFYKLNSWGPGHFFMNFSSLTPGECNFNFFYNQYPKLSEFQTKICSHNSNLDHEVFVNETVTNCAPNPNMKLELNLNCSSEKNCTFAIRNLLIDFLYCDASCLSCSGPNPNECLSCLDKFYLTASKTCSPCSSLCEKCDSSTNCLKCSSDKYSIKNETYSGCVDICPNGNFVNNFTCVNQCPNYMYFYQFVCYYECPIGLVSKGQECMNECPSILYLIGNTCVTKCPNYHFNKTCVNYCPFYAIFDNKTCSSSCPKNTFELKLYCYSDCPKNYLNFNGSCVTECPTLYIAENKTCHLNCSNFVFNSTCLEICPEGYYADSSNVFCSPCNEKCKTCFGLKEDQCLSCNSTNEYYLKELGYCLESCPQYYYTNSESKECLKCSENCIECQDNNYCINCDLNISIKIGNVCKIKKEFKASLVEIDNPNNFQIILSQNWFYLIENCLDFFKSLSIGNLNNSKDYDLKLYCDENKDNKTINLSLKYNKAYQNNENLMNIWLHGQESLSDKFYNFIDQNLTINLQSITIICTKDEYVSPTTKNCVFKTKLSISLVYDSDPLTLSLRFSGNYAQLSQNVQSFSNISISKFDRNDFNYSISNSSLSTFKIKISSPKAIVNGPIFSYYLNISDYVLNQNDMYMPVKSTSLKLLDYYPISEDLKVIGASVSQQAKTGSSAAQSSGYASTIFSSGSSMFVIGLMLMEMIFCLKYIEINYPPNVMPMFESNNDQITLFFHFNFINDPNDANVLPLRFQYYEVSEYFLNNVGENICQIFTIFFLATCLNLMIPYKENPEKKLGFIKKIMILIRDTLVWEVTLFYLLMNLQKIMFFIACTWMFPPLNSVNAFVNLSIASVIGFFVIIWIYHLFFKIKACQNFKEEILYNTSKNVSIRTLPKPLPIDIKNKKSNCLSNEPKKTMDFWIFSPETSNQQSIGKSRTYKKSPIQNQVEYSPSTLQIPALDFNKSKEYSKRISFFKKLKTKLSLSFIRKFLLEPQNKIFFLKKYQLLHLDFKSKKTIHRYYAFIYYLRQCLIGVMVVILSKHPLLVTILINVVNIIFIIYTIISQPFTSKYMFVVSIVDELITEAALSSGMILAIFDEMDELDYEKRMNLGWVIIFSNIILLYWVIITGIMKPIIIVLIAFIEKRRNLSKVHPEKEENK